ncbi:response regulator [Nocardia farcinica]|uniref:response regulator n=1 Tax=Nocardia farcinica TaxID=37329 RepID=UPI001895FD83|nr:response regulator transcription factor [Nocardia farcinica]MBF6139560.1 response regulator transcription factor [Nocardia farcinica]MBF6382828.1 response regulator transcription factor [Nocardia farcinica]MBF6538381.1 response regulator transcription factor [Nocardia farcinica]
MSRPAPIRVLVADDEPLVRAGVTGILGTDPGIAVVAEAGTGPDALAAARAHALDAVVLDIRMPGLSGLEVLRELRGEGHTVGCLFVTTFGEDDYIAEAVRLAADGFVLKSGDPRELILGVHAVASGGAFFSPAIARRLLDGRPTARFDRAVAARRRFAALTPREQEILRLVSRGWSNAEIAADLHLAPGTVKVHVSSILRTTGARNRVEAALVAVHADELDTLGDPPHRNR